MSTKDVRRTKGVPVDADFYNNDGTPLVVDTTNVGLYIKDDAGNIVNVVGHVYGDFQVDGHTILGDQGTEGTGINILGMNFDSTLKVSDIDGTNLAQTILHRHSTTLEPVIVGARSNSNDNSHVDVTHSQGVMTIIGSGWVGSNYKVFGSIGIGASASGTLSNTSAPGRIVFQTTPNGALISSPTLTLENDKSATFAGSALFPAGTPSAPSLSFSSDTDTGIYSSAANNITFTTNSTARMQLNNSGLAIGDYLAASYPLEVWKNSDSILARFARGGATNNPRLEVSAVEATKTLTLDATGSTTPNLEIKTGGTARMTVNTTGQVGIGTSPNANYALATDVYYTGAASIGMVNIGRSGGDYPSVGYNFRTTNTSGSYLYNATDLASRLEFYAGGFRFYPANSGTPGATITANTTHNFRADGRVGFNSSGDANYTFSISSFSDSGNHYAFNVASVGWATNIFSVTGTGEIYASGSGAGLRLGTTSNFGINTRQTVYFTGAGTQYGCLYRPQYDNAFPIFFFNAAASQVGYIYTTASATTYYSSSDYRLKENTTPITDGLARISRLKPYRFQWKADGANDEGFLAHEVQSEIPVAVRGEKDAMKDGKPDYQMMDMSKIVPTIVAAMKELIEENNAQQQQINDLMARVAVLEAL